MKPSPVVVITGSSRGLGFALAREFLSAGCRVALCGKSPDHLARAKEQLNEFRERILAVPCAVEDPDSLEALWQQAATRWGEIGIWINNAGISQPYRPFVSLTPDDIAAVVNTNLLGVLHGTRTALSGMIRQGHGAIWNMEGFGSNDMVRIGLTAYGTTKRALTYFTRAMAVETRGTGVTIGALSPGMMITDLLTRPLERSPDLERMKKFFNILADRPETVARFLVPRILQNQTNGAHLVWLTRRKALLRFLSAPFVRRDLFHQAVP